MKGDRAFTLVEMTVALAVTSVLTVLMLRMFTDSSTIWRRQEERLDSFREARAALQLMSRDFATILPIPGATSPGGTEQFPILALRDLRTRVVPDLPVEAYYTSAYALAGVRNAGGSDLCAVGYFLQWEPDTANDDPTATRRPKTRSAFALRRQLARSDTTFAALQDTLSASTPLFGEAAFTGLYSLTAKGTLPAPKVDTLASYIWDLQFSPAPAAASASGAPPPAPPTNAFYGRELPQYLEIRFKALGATGARKLEDQPITAETWTKPSEEIYRRLILPGEQQFVTRVKLSR